MYGGWDRALEGAPRDRKSPTTGRLNASGIDTSLCCSYIKHWDIASRIQSVSSQSLYWRVGSPRSSNTDGIELSDGLWPLRGR